MPLDINHLYRRYGSMVFRRCRQLLKDDGDDGVHVGFLNIARSSAVALPSASSASSAMAYGAGIYGATKPGFPTWAS